jgi:hypothetical protein
MKNECKNDHLLSQAMGSPIIMHCHSPHPCPSPSDTCSFSVRAVGINSLFALNSALGDGRSKTKLAFNCFKKHRDDYVYRMFQSSVILQAARVLALHLFVGIMNKFFFKHHYQTELYSHICATLLLGIKR